MGYHGVTAPMYDTYAAYITTAGQCMWIGTFYTADEAARTYDATAWRFGRAQSKLKFCDVESTEAA
jgi:hypothetical protein